MYDSLTFFHKSAGRTDIERGIRVLQLRGKSVFCFEFDDGYALYCVMLLYKRSGQCIFFQQLSKYINTSPSVSSTGKL